MNNVSKILTNWHHHLNCFPLLFILSSLIVCHFNIILLPYSRPFIYRTTRSKIRLGWLVKYVVVVKYKYV